MTSFFYRERASNLEAGRKNSLKLLVKEPKRPYSCICLYDKGEPRGKQEKRSAVIGQLGLAISGSGEEIGVTGTVGHFIC
jgi:hypothetical protein